MLNQSKYNTTSVICYIFFLHGKTYGRIKEHKTALLHMSIHANIYIQVVSLLGISIPFQGRILLRPLQRIRLLYKHYNSYVTSIYKT